MWKFAVLEIYTHDIWGDEWPAEGTPADWIERGLVMWGEANIQDFYAHIPLKSVLTAKVIDKLEALRDWTQDTSCLAALRRKVRRLGGWRNADRS